MDAHDTVRQVLLRLPKRRRLYEAIVATPGLHLRALSRSLQMALGVAEHHARALEQHGLVFCHAQGRRRTYFAVGQVGPDDAARLHALGKASWRGVLDVMLDGAPHDAHGLSVQLGIPQDRVGHALRGLHKAGWLDRVAVGRVAVFTLRDAAAFAALLRPTAHGFDGVLERARMVERPRSLDDRPRPAAPVSVRA